MNLQELFISLIIVSQNRRLTLQDTAVKEGWIQIQDTGCRKQLIGGLDTGYRIQDTSYIRVGNR